MALLKDGTRIYGNATVDNNLTTGGIGYFNDIALLDDLSPSNYLRLTNSANLTADRILSVNVNDADRSITLSGNLSLANSFTTSGNFALTLTTTAATNVTLPTSGTLATTAGTLSNSTTSTQSGYFGNIFLYDDSTPSHYLGITNSANLTAARTLSVNVNDADRTISLSGNLTVSAAATVSGTNTGDQTITLTGDVTGTGTGSFATTIANSAVTYAKIQNISATDRILGRSTAGAGVVEEITCTAAGRALLDDADAAAQRTTLGLGTIATQASNSVSITGGSVTGITDITLADGGTNASLTAVNGGIVYSTATALAISSAGSAGQILRSAGAAAPSWSTATYPATTTINQILYSSAANTISGLATANGGVLITSASGVPSILTGTSGQFLKSNGSNAATWSTLEMTDIPGAVFKKSVKAATTADLGAVTYANGTAGVGATITGGLVVFPAQDGVTLAVNDRILVKNQTTAAQNGIYVLTTVGVAATTAWVLTRTTDADTNVEIGAAVVAIDEGTANGGEIWTTNFKSTDTVGTTAMSWNELLYNNFSGPTFAGTLNAATIQTSGNIELGNASDTTLSRSAAGRLAVEGVNVVTVSSTDTLTNKTLTAPRITSASHIADSNGNELIIFPAAVASAVNEITISNAATAGTPSITASGGDTNVSLNISAKGTGTVNLPSGTTKIGTTTITQGGAVGITLPSTAGTLALTSEILTNSSTSTQSGYFGDIFLYDDSTPSHYLQITNSANLTAARSLSINVNDANRIISLSGDLSLANSFSTSGAFALTLTTTAATNVTLPTTGTLATTAGTLSSSTTSTQAGYFGDIYLYDDSTPSHYLQITNGANLTAARTLTLNTGDASRTVTLSGNLSIANNFTTSGNFALTLTTTAATSVTLPTSGTLVNSTDLANVAATVTTLSSSITSYELDDISTAVDGIENTFVPTFNYDKVALTDPFKLLITVNGIIQSAFVFNKDYVHLTHCLAAKTGYTVDQDGNIKFTESIPMGSEVIARLNGSTTHSTYRYYPFSALDIMLYK